MALHAAAYESRVSTRACLGQEETLISNKSSSVTANTLGHAVKKGHTWNEEEDDRDRNTWAYILEKIDRTPKVAKAEDECRSGVCSTPRCRKCHDDGPLNKNAVFPDAALILFHHRDGDGEKGRWLFVDSTDHVHGVVEIKDYYEGGCHYAIAAGAVEISEKVLCMDVGYVAPSEVQQSRHDKFHEFSLQDQKTLCAFHEEAEFQRHGDDEHCYAWIPPQDPSDSPEFQYGGFLYRKCDKTSADYDSYFWYEFIMFRIFLSVEWP